MYVDGALLIDNGGSHGPQIVSGTVTLSSGKHDILITYFQVLGGKTLQFWYSGPDTNWAGQRPAADKWFTVPTSTISCFVTCGSLGEVASVPIFGHQKIPFDRRR